MPDFYHYTQLEQWHNIEHGTYISGGEPGLGPNTRVCTEYFDDARATQRAVFGLTEPEPQSWVDNPDYPLAWKRLMTFTGNLLLTYTLPDDLVDASYIVDWSHRERAHGYHREDIGTPHPPKLLREEKQKAEKQYWESRVPLGEYITNPSTLGKFSLPEVITMKTIPFECISIAEVQPIFSNPRPGEIRALERAIKTYPSLEVLGRYVT